MKHATTTTTTTSTTEVGLAAAAAAAADDDGDDDNNKETFKFYCTFPAAYRESWGNISSAASSPLPLLPSLPLLLLSFSLIFSCFKLRYLFIYYALCDCLLACACFSSILSIVVVSSSTLQVFPQFSRQP